MHRQLGEVGSPTLRKSEVAKCECVHCAIRLLHRAFGAGGGGRKMGKDHLAARRKRLREQKQKAQRFHGLLGAPKFSCMFSEASMIYLRHCYVIWSGDLQGTKSYHFLVITNFETYFAMTNCVACIQYLMTKL